MLPPPPHALVAARPLEGYFAQNPMEAAAKGTVNAHLERFDALHSGDSEMTGPRTKARAGTDRDTRLKSMSTCVVAST